MRRGCTYIRLLKVLIREMKQKHMNNLNMKSVLSIMAVAVTSLFLFGCTEFVNPLAPESQAKVDKNLLGHWLEIDSYGTETKGTADFSALEGKKMSVNQVSSSGTATTYTFIPNKVDDKRYMSIYSSSATGAGFYIYRYEIAPNEKSGTVLTVWSLPTDTLTKAFESKALMSTKTADGYDKILSTSEQIQKWIVTLGDLDWLVAYRYKRAK